VGPAYSPRFGEQNGRSMHRVIASCFQLNPPQWLSSDQAHSQSVSAVRWTNISCTPLFIRQYIPYVL